MINKERIIGQFVDLVQIDSETKSERKIADYLKMKFATLGLQVIEDDSMTRTGHAAGNLVATLEATSGTNVDPFLFTCHMDTVVPGQGIKPIIGEDGWIRSDGTTILGADDKAGLAVLFEVIQVLQEQQLAHGRIQFVITVGEESGLVGARSIDRSLLDARYGFALDSNGEVGAICVGAPTQAKVEIEIFGKSAHAGVNPEDGISAIQVAAKAISRMKLGRIDEETTANIGKFEGGGPTNVVTDYVKLTAEARSLSQDKVERQLALMKDAVDTACQDFGARGQMDSVIVYPAFRLTEQDQVVLLAQKAAKKLGLSGRLFTSGGGSDANIMNGLGIPTVNLAVGYENIHTTQERIHKDDIIKLAEYALEIVRQSLNNE